jgi:hypothetical protein
MHGPGTWILRQQVGGEGEQDLSELRNMHAQVYAQLPKKRVLHIEGCWESASWDVIPMRNTTQLWRCGPRAVPVAGSMANALSPDAVQSYMEQWVHLRYAFHWGHGLAPPSQLTQFNELCKHVGGFSITN